VIFQFEASSLTDSLPSVTDEGGLQDIENFSIFKGLNGMCHAIWFLSENQCLSHLV